MGGTIPGLPNGDFHAGLHVDVDMDTMTVVGTSLINAPPPDIPTSTQPELPTTSQDEAASIDQQQESEVSQ